MKKSRRSITDLALHLHPPSVPQETLRFTLSFGLGGMALVLTCLLFLSGALLLLTYQPSVDGAYNSILILTREVRFGPWVRNVHYLSANLLIIITLLHLLRVLLTGAIGLGRRLNWVIGLLLLFLLLCSNFTGYLLPWDQLAYWAVTICTSMLSYVPLCGNWLQELFRGGAEIGGATLSNFFVLHVAFIPASLILLMMWHFWLVRRAGGLVQKGAESDETPLTRVPVAPHLIVREAAVGLSLTAIVLLLAIIIDAPLLEQANPGMSPNPAKSPWYFLGFQELLLHLHPTFAIFIWPLLGASALLVAPFWNNSALPGSIWFGSARGRKLAIWSSALASLMTALIIWLDNLLLASTEPIADTLMTRGLAPTILLLALLVGVYLLLTIKLKHSRAEAVMALILMLLAGLTICTMTGVWFRGAEMQLLWPWQIMPR